MSEKTVNQLYAEEMDVWFAEHERIADQQRRTSAHYRELADLNDQQLELGNQRLSLHKAEYNIWAMENGFPEWE